MRTANYGSIARAHGARWASAALVVVTLGGCEVSSSTEGPEASSTGGSGSGSGASGGSTTSGGGSGSAGRGFGGTAGSSGSAGAGRGGMMGGAGYPSCCTANPCEAGEQLGTGYCVDGFCRVVRDVCSCDVYCKKPYPRPPCDPGDEFVGHECPAEDGCYRRTNLAAIAWCRHVGGEGGAGGEAGGAGENAR